MGPALWPELNPKHLLYCSTWGFCADGKKGFLTSPEGQNPEFLSVRTRLAPLEGTTGFLKEIFSKDMTPMGMVDNVMRVHSLRPYTIQRSLHPLQKCVVSLENQSSLWYLEGIAFIIAFPTLVDTASKPPFQLRKTVQQFKQMPFTSWCSGRRRTWKDPGC